MRSGRPDLREARRCGSIACRVLAVLVAASPAAGETLYAEEDVLSDNDVGGPEDMTQEGRWGPPQAEGARTCRQYPKALSRVGVRTWWEEEGSPGEDVMVVVAFKDTTSEAVTVAGWTGAGGIYGYPVIGLIGGANDGRWKEGFLFCPKDQIRRHPDGEWKGHWSLLFCRGNRILVGRVKVIRAAGGLTDECVRQARARRAASVKALKKKFKHVPRAREDVGTLVVTREQTRLGFVPYRRSYTLDVYPDTVPRPEERGAEPLRSYATPGEFEPVQVAAYALTDVTITASVSDLTGPGVLRAGRDVEVFWIECSPVRPKSSWGKEWQLRPTWLRPSEPRYVPARTSQAWLVRVRVPPDAEPGVYRGTFRLSTGGGGAASFPVEFRVLPFRLDRVDDYAWGAYVSGIISDEHIRDLAEHGMNSLSMFGGNGLVPRLEGGKCVVDLSPAMDDYLRRLGKAGFVRVVNVGGGDPAYDNPSQMRTRTRANVGTPRFEEYYGQFWKDIRRLEKENGWPEIICCPFDEPVKSEAKTRNYLTCYDIVKKAAPSTKVFCVFMNRGNACRRLGRKADIWSCNGAFAANRAEKKRLAAEGVHRLFYTYTGCMAGYRPGSARYNSGVVPWHYDADGTYFWAYLWTADDPFNDLDGGHRDWTPAARDADGKLYTCTCWEGYREGVDDRRYIETCVRLAGEKGREDVLDGIAGIRKGISPGRESKEGRRTSGLDDFFIELDNAVELDVIRARVVGMILDMLAAQE